MKKLLFILPVFFLFYTLFWFQIFKLAKKANQKIAYTTKSIPVQQNSVAAKEVLGNQTNSEVIFPESYKINLMPRRQAFNLSCEFASAATIIWHFTNNPDFSVNNEKEAEKILMEKVGVSENPNLGIRMGEKLPNDFQTLLINLNQMFGGADYYGVHAPPFIDLFSEYKLTAKPINKNKDMIAEIKRAIYSGHLVMAWLKVGYGRPVDLVLSYGNIPVIRGEHTVVATGFDKDGIIFMDPAAASERHLDNNYFLEAINLFPVPLLEVSLALSSDDSFESIFQADQMTGLKRNNLKIIIENGTKKTGVANQMAEILKDFGYQVVEIKNADNFDYQDISLQIKDKMKDYLYLLKKDLTLANYQIATAASDLKEENREDAIIIVGESQ